MVVPSEHVGRLGLRRRDRGQRVHVRFGRFVAAETRGGGFIETGPSFLRLTQNNGLPDHVAFVAQVVLQELHALRRFQVDGGHGGEYVRTGSFTCTRRIPKSAPEDTLERVQPSDRERVIRGGEGVRPRRP